MSTRKFARDVPRAVQAVVRVAIELAVDGEVVGGMRALQEGCGHDSAASTREAVEAAERLGLLRRVGPVGHGPRRVLLVEARRFSGGVCVDCAQPTTRQRCHACTQAFRADRAWEHEAVTLAVQGRQPSAIAVRLSQPLWPTTENVKCVAWVLAQEGLLDVAWKAALIERCPKLGKRLTERERTRRARAKPFTDVPQPDESVTT